MEQRGSAGEFPGELDGGFHALAAGAGEKDLAELATCEGAEAVRQGSGQVWNVALQHGRAATVEFVVKRLDDGGVIVADIVDAVAGEEVEDHVAGFGVEFGPLAANVPNIHLEQIQEPLPLGVYIV